MMSRSVSPGADDEVHTMKPLYSPRPKTSKTELCARIDELQEENDKLRDMLHSWRDWYERHYKAHVLYLDDKIKTLSDPNRLDRAEISPSSRHRVPSPPAAPPLPVLESPNRRQMEKFYAERRRSKFDDRTMRGSLREKSFDEFLQRQTTAASRSAREEALLNRAYVDGLNPNNFAGLGKAGKDFRMKLRRRFGSMRKGWIEALDVTEAGKLGFFEFCTAVRTMGFDSGMKQLWEELTGNGDKQALGYADIDPRGAAATKDLKFFMIDTYGSILRAWTEFVDANGEKKDVVKIGAFVDACARMGWEPAPGVPAAGAAGTMEKDSAQTAAKRVWCHVNANGVEEVGASSGFITLKDFCEDSARARARGLKDSFAMVETPKKGRPLPGGPVSPAGSPLTTTQMSWNSGSKGAAGLGQSSPLTMTQSSWPSLVPPPLPDASVTDYAHLPDPNYSHCKVTQSFLGTLRRKFKSVRDGWYKALDPHGKAMLTYDEFAENCKTRLRYYGSVDKVFNTLDYQNSGMVAMSDFNPRAHECLRDIQFQLVQRFGNILDAFHPYHIGTSNELDMESWTKMLVPFNFKLHDVQNVFLWLDMLDKKRIRGTSIEFAKVGAPSKLSRYERMSAERNQDEVHMRWQTDAVRENPDDDRALTVTRREEQSPSDIERLADPDFVAPDAAVPEPPTMPKKRAPASGAQSPTNQSEKSGTGKKSSNGGSRPMSPASQDSSSTRKQSNKAGGKKGSSPKASPKAAAAEPASSAAGSSPRPKSPASSNGGAKNGGRPESRGAASNNGAALETVPENQQDRGQSPPAAEDGGAGTARTPQATSPEAEAATAGPTGSESLNPNAPKVEFGKKPYPPTYTPECISLLGLISEKHGSLKAGWAQVFAPNGEHEIDFVQFCRGLRALEFEGNLKKTWDSMGQAEANMSMHVTDLNPETEALFQQWKQKHLVQQVNGTYSFENAWSKRMGASSAGISCNEMIAWLCDDNTMTPAEAESVCEWLDGRGDLQERNFLSLAELDAASGRKLVLPQ